MAISLQRLTIYLHSAHRVVIFAIAQLSCSLLLWKLLFPSVPVPRSYWCKSESVSLRWRMTIEKPFFCFNACQSPSNEIGCSRSCEGVNAMATVQTILQPLKNYVLPLIPSCFSCLLQIPAHASLTPTYGIYHHLQPETTCSQFDITRQTLCSWQCCHFVTRVLYAYCYWLCNCFSILLSCHVCSYVSSSACINERR